MNKIERVRDFVRSEAIRFGAKTEGNKSFVERNNTKDDALNDNGAYFGFILPEEDITGPYHDFSLTIFPTDLEKPWLVCLGIGSNGFKNDYELSTYPGVRRLFSNLVDERGYCKSDFSDIETNLPKVISTSEDLRHLSKTIKKYSSVLPVCQTVDDPESITGKKIISAFIAAYAKLRDWPTNNEQRKALSEALRPFFTKRVVDEKKEILDLILERRYIVLQGPPGTGKTRTAKELANLLGTTIFFTQFHAETSYSDFIYGIRPNLTDNSINYVEKIGVFSEAVKYAFENKNEKVLLIIDEINRANLSNVLGPIFYLFEHKMDLTNVQLELFPNYNIEQLPENLYVIATMNTADRSLAVVDFALRRRFAWYTLIPKPIESNFFLDDFNSIKEIFNWYATNNELSLQPGQGYFIAFSEEEMINRIQYEILPLIKEYLQEGLLVSAKEEFNNYFSNRINKSLFE